MSNATQSAGGASINSGVPAQLRDLAITSVLDNSPEGIWVHEAGKIIYANPGITRILGYDNPGQIIGKRVSEFFPQEYQDELRSRVNRAIETGIAAPARECEMLRRDGERVSAEITGSRLTGGESNILIAYIRDITQRKKAEQLLRQRKGDYRATLDAIPDLLFELDSEGRYLAYHSPKTDLLAAPPDVLMGKLVSDVLPPDASAVVMAALHEANETGYSYGKQFHLPLPHGSFWFELAVSRKSASDAATRFIVLSRDISQRKRDEVLLAEQARMLDGIFEHTLDNIVLLDRDYNFIRVSQTYADACKRDIDEFAGKNHFALFPSPLKDEFDEARERKSVYSRKARPFVFPDHPEWGVSYWDLGLVPLFDGDGEIQMFIFTLKDVTKTVESEQRLLEAQRISLLGSWELNLQTNALVWSEEIFRIFEIDQSNTIPSYDTFLQAIHPEDRDAVDKAYTNSVATRTPYEIEHRLLMPDGRIKWVSERCETHYDAAGNPQRSIGTVRDITKQKQALLALADSEQFNRRLLEAMQDGLTIVDTIGRQTDVNPAFCAMTGFSREELVNHRVPFAYWPPEHLKIVDLAFQKTLRGQFERFELTFMRKNGERFPVIVSPFAITDNSGNAVAFAATVKDITEHKQLETKLRQNGMRLSEAHRIAGLGAWEVDLITDKRWWSEENYRLTGVTPGTPLTRELVATLVYPDDRELVAGGLATMMATGNWEGEYRLVRSDGELRVIRTRASAVFDDSGKVIRLSGINRDITQQKRLEMAQRAAGAGTWDWDMTNQQIVWSPELYDLFGLDARTDEASFAAWERVMHPDDRETAGKRIEEAIQAKSQLTNEYRIVRPDGEERWINALGNTEYDRTGQPVRMTGICIDITERKRKEFELARIYRELETMKFALDEHSIVGTTDANGIITYANDRFCQISGYSRDELIGRTHAVVNSGFHPRSFFSDMWQTITAGRVWQGEIRNRRKTGELYWVETSIVPVMDATTGKPTQFIGIRTDITARKKYLDSLNQSLSEKEMLLAEVHHRVKNNLQVISSLISMQSHLIKDKEALLHLGSLSLRIRAMGLLHTQLYKSTDIGRVAMRDYLTSIIEQVLSAQRQNANYVDTTIDIDEIYLNIETSLPIGLIVNEIISNSLKYAFAAIDKPTLKVALKAKDGKFLLEICDNGPGLPPNIDTQLSLGMRLIHVLAKQLHGDVEILSTSGACFHIDFYEQSKEEKRWERDS